MNKKYRAEFPMSQGDMAVRYYDTASSAISVARRHFKAVKGNLCFKVYCSVIEIDSETGERKTIYKEDER